MKLLAWDTSSKVGALAAIEWNEGDRAGWSGVRLASEWTLNVDSQHSERLLWSIHEVLEASRWKLSDVDVFAVGVGPGSFTGLRIGVTTARTLAHSMNKRLIPVSSLAALARPAAQWLANHARDRSRTIIVAATDAAKGDLFALWGSARSVLDCSVRAENDFPGLWKRGVEEEVLAPEELIKAVKKKMSEGVTKKSKNKNQWAVLGEARTRYPEVWKSLPAALRVDVPAAFSEHVQGRYLAQLAWESFQTGVVRNPLAIHPRYLRVADAELKLQKGLLPPGPTRGHLE
jgi:tRNA threonylcarbamoyl adenosine modification protein YeaZ